MICENFLEKSEALVNIGIAGTDNFGCQVTTEKIMPNYQYDCTNPRAPFCQGNNNNNHFNLVCVGSVSEQTGPKTYHTIDRIIK